MGRSAATSRGPAGWSSDAEEIWAASQAAVAAAWTGTTPRAVAAVGLTNQRESARAVGPRQRRAARPGPRLAGPAHGRRLRAAARAGGRRWSRATAACLSTRCSRRPRPRWLLDPTTRAPARRRRLCLGTVDSWLLLRLRRRARDRGRQRRPHPAAGRRRRLGHRAAGAVRRPRAVLPAWSPPPGHSRRVGGLAAAGRQPVGAVLGDSHAALFAHAGWRPGTVKATYGTGSSVMGLGRPPTTPDAGCA